MEILGTLQVIVIYIKTHLPIPKNVKNQGWDSFCKIFQIVDDST
jgi:hypothetical protein